MRLSLLRPLPLMLAVLYKIQERNDTFFKQSGTLVKKIPTLYSFLMQSLIRSLSNLKYIIRYRYPI